MRLQPSSKRRFRLVARRRASVAQAVRRLIDRWPAFGGNESGSLFNSLISFSFKGANAGKRRRHHQSLPRFTRNGILRIVAPWMVKAMGYTGGHRGRIKLK